MTVTADFKSKVFASRTTEGFQFLITFSHDSFTDDIRVCSDPAVLLPEANVRGMISNGLEYIFFPFDFSLPEQNDTGISRARISIDNIDRRVVQAIRGANGPINVSFAVVKSSDPDTYEFLAENFRLEHADYDAFAVSGDITVEYFDLEPYPFARMTPSYFPGMF